MPPKKIQPSQVKGPFLPPASSPGFVNGTPDWVKPIIQRASEKHNIPTVMLSALLKQESGFNVNARSPVGAQGIAQFMPGTAKGMGVNPNDPESAIDGAARYLRGSWDKFGKPELALAAYNAGGGAVAKYGGIPPYKETQNYVKNIMAMAGQPHSSFYQPILDTLSNAKKDAEKFFQDATTKAPSMLGSMQQSSPTMQNSIPESADAGVLPLPIKRGMPNMPLAPQLQNSPLMNDLGQMQAPTQYPGIPDPHVERSKGFIDKTWQGIYSNDLLANQMRPPLQNLTGNWNIPTRYAQPISSVNERRT